MSACKPLIGHQTRLALIANPNCLLTPKVERVIITVAATAPATTVTLGLDPAYVAGGYTATTIRNLYANTVLFFGSTAVKVVKDYVIGTTPIAVEVAPLTANIAANATADTYLAAIICLESKGITTNPQTGSANEDCDEGQLTQVTTGFTRELTLSGQISSSAGFWLLLNQLGETLENAFWYQDYRGLYGEYGSVQLSPPSFNNNTVGSVVNFSATGQIKGLKKHLPVNLVGFEDPLNLGQPVLTAAQVTANNAVRQLYGLKALVSQ